jgi:hypothetical protein
VVEVAAVVEVAVVEVAAEVEVAEAARECSFPLT